jgi:hypothetical protein
MRNCLTILLNIVFQKELELYYGKGSIVEVNEFKYCNSTKTYVVDCKVLSTDVDLLLEMSNHGLKLLLSESMKYTGFDDPKITLIFSCDLIN